MKRLLGAALLAFAGLASAQTATLSTGASCAYTSVAVGPGGNMAIACVGVAPPVVVPPVVVPPAVPVPPAPATGGQYIEWNLKLSGSDILRMHSGQVASAVLPSVKAAGGQTNSGQIIFGEATVSPRAVTIEIAVSRSRGLIDPNAGGGFYIKSNSGSFTKLEWIEHPIWGTRTDYIAGIYGVARAYLEQGPWYVNVRYTYAAGDCQYSPCGFTNQWNFGSY